MKRDRRGGPFSIGYNGGMKRRAPASYLRSAVAERHSFWVLRLALAIVYVWFGLLKALGLSPATELVHALFDRTIAWMIPFGTFFALFSWFEVAIGALFLFPRLTRVAVALTLAHVITTVMPLVLMPGAVWDGAFVPTLEGQYIIKNVLIVAAAFALLARHERTKS